MDVGGYRHNYEGFYEKISYQMSINRGRTITTPVPMQWRGELLHFFFSPSSFFSSPLPSSSPCLLLSPCTHTRIWGGAELSSLCLLLSPCKHECVKGRKRVPLSLPALVRAKGEGGEFDELRARDRQLHTVSCQNKVQNYQFN